MPWEVKMTWSEDLQKSWCTEEHTRAKLLPAASALNVMRSPYACL